MPPLRDRREDIPQLVANFVEHFNKKLGKSVRSFSAQAMDLMFSHHWPGNVREMENVVERSMVLAKDEIISAEDLPPELRFQEHPMAASDRAETLNGLEKDHVCSVLEKCGWNKYRAAKIMGISRSTLYSKMKKHGLAEAH